MAVLLNTRSGRLEARPRRYQMSPRPTQQNLPSLHEQNLRFTNLTGRSCQAGKMRHFYSSDQ
ncbi:hypothetical protein PRBEI_2000541800 [Prionailurus iriomotensis]